MTWCLLGKEDIFSDRPILSGSHAQHLYLATKGATSLHYSGRSVCYDPANYGAYPKTPIFNGSRLGEVFLFLAGGSYQPVAYKLGLAFMCLLVPWLLILAARGIDQSWPTTTLAAAAGLLVWWSPYSLEGVQAGASELLLGSLAGLAHTGLLVRFDRHPGLVVWIGLVFTAWLGWFAQPMLFPIVLLLFLCYYAHVGHRHTALFWHFSLLLAELLALALTLTWMIDWVTFWWLRAPLPAASTLQHRTLQTVWNAPLWGGPADRTMGLFLLGSAAIGVVIMPRGRRTVSRILALGAGGLFLLALLGISWEPLGTLGTAGLLAPALWFASLPAAQTWMQGFNLLKRWLGPWQAGLLLVILAGLAVGFGQEFLPPLSRLVGIEPLETELGPEREALIQTLIDRTQDDARILWEDLPHPRTALQWSPLLPILTGRAFVGGLDPEATIEHATIGLTDQNLQGQHLSVWKDAELEEYCFRYNIGWVVCFAPASIQRFGDWPAAQKLADVKDGDVPGVLFAVKRSPHGYALRGQAQMIHADIHHITLADVVPDNGVVVLSLHYQTGMTASPSRVHVECEPSALDPIGFIRLRLAGPAARVTLTWSDR